MQAEIDRKALSESLFFLSGVLSNNPEFLVLGYIDFQCEPKNQRIVLRTTNIETTVVSEIKTVFDPDDIDVDFLVPAKQFINIINASSADKLLIKFSDKTMTLRYSLGQTSGKLKCIEADDFPKPLLSTNQTIKITARQLWDMITKTVISCDITYSSRIALTGVNMVIDNDVFQMTSGDGYRLSTYRHKLDSTYQYTNVIVPAKYLKPLRSMLRRFEDDHIVRIRMLSGQNSKLIFEFGDTFYVTQVLSETFPDVSGIFGISFNLVVAVSASALGEAIAMHSSYSSQNYGATFFKSNDKDQYCMVSSTQDSGAVGTVITDLNGLILPDICFNVQFLSEYVKVCGSDQIFIYLNNESSPLYLRSTSDIELDPKNEGLGFSYFIMPIGESTPVQEHEYDYSGVDIPLLTSAPVELVQTGAESELVYETEDQTQSYADQPKTYIEGITDIVNDDYPF